MDKTIYRNLHLQKITLPESHLGDPGDEETVDSFIEAGKCDMYFYDIFIFFPTFPLHFP